MIGGHMIKACSKTQNSISLSSAEAELIAMVKLSTELLGLMSLARDVNCRLHGRVWADSSAALAIVKRSGAGKLRHINISLLRVQEQQKMKKFTRRFLDKPIQPISLPKESVGKNFSNLPGRQVRHSWTDVRRRACRCKVFVFCKLGFVLVVNFVYPVGWLSPPLLMIEGPRILLH